MRVLPCHVFVRNSRAAPGNKLYNLGAYNFEYDGTAPVETGSLPPFARPLPFAPSKQMIFEIYFFRDPSCEGGHGSLWCPQEGTKGHRPAPHDLRPTCATGWGLNRFEPVQPSRVRTFEAVDATFLC